MTDRQPAIHAFTQKYNGRAVRLISDVGVSLPFDPQSAGPDQSVQQVMTRALWDTGASRSVITPTLAASVGLVPVGRVMARHVQGETEVNQYLVNLYLPNGVGVPGLMVSEFTDTEGFAVIIGMDVMTHGDLAITNVGGETWLTFRTPSVARIDYVAEANKAKYAGVPRNAPCPCGKTYPSGKAVKFKDCHGAG